MKKSMSNFLQKYDTLSLEIQREVDDFIEFLLLKSNDKKAFDMKSWKEKIKAVSVWSEEDFKEFKN